MKQNKLARLISCFTFLLLALISSKAQIEENKILIPKQPIERELAGGQAHKYRFEAKANEFLQIKVEQKGINVVVKLFDKDGKLMSEIDISNGIQGFELLSFIAVDAAAYTVEVSSPEVNAAKGSYIIFQEIPRSATEKDKKGIEANKLFAEANSLAAQGTAEAFQSTLQKLEKALLLYKDGGFKDDEAFTSVFLGNIHNSLNQKQKAIEYFSAALNLMKELGDKQGEALALNNLALTLSDLGENQRALKYYDEILPLFKQVGDKKGIAVTLNNIGAIYSNLGEKQKSLEFYLQALPMFKEINDQRNIATTLNNIGLIYGNIGENQKAIEYYNQTLNSFKTMGDIAGVVVALNNIASAYSRLGEKQKALDYFTQVLNLLKQIGNKQSEAITLNNMGVLYSTLGEKQKALEYFNQALSIFDALGLKQPQATLLSNIGGAYDDLNNWGKSIETYEKALQILKAVGDKRSEAKTLNNLGRVYTELRNKEKSLEYYNEALKLSKIYNDRELEAKTLSNLGLVFSFLFNDKQRALDYYNRALPLHQTVGDRDGAANTLANLMYALDFLGNKRLAILYGKQSINVSQGLRADIKGLDRELQKSFLGTIEGNYRKLVQLLIEEKRLPEAEQVLRMLKEEEYFEFVRRDGSVVLSLDERISVTPSEKQAADQYEKVSLEIKQIGKEYEETEREKSTASSIEQVKNITAKQEELNKRLEAAATKSNNFLSQLSKNFNKAASGSESVEESSQAVVKEWKAPQTAIISTVVGHENLSLIVTTSQFQRGYVINISEEKLNKLVGEFRAAIIERKDVQPTAQELYNVLMKPLEKDLKAAKAKTLVWSLDKFLRYVPVSALWDKDKGYLVQNYANVVLALASRQNLALRPEKKNQWQALGVGVSKEAEGFAPLSYVTEELQAIVRDSSAQSKEKEFGIIEGRRLLNEQFTYDNFLKNLRNYRFAHAASHFRFIPGTKAEGLNSFLLLGNGEKLTLAQIQNSDKLFEGIELLTLSACDTAYGGKTADGREIEGFGVLAQRKGAKAIMATLWMVNDESTRDFMVDFYELYQKPGITKAEALRKAQVYLLQKSEFGHPYYWSPFVLIGNWW